MTERNEMMRLGRAVGPARLWLLLLLVGCGAHGSGDVGGSVVQPASSADSESVDQTELVAPVAPVVLNTIRIQADVGTSNALHIVVEGRPADEDPVHLRTQIQLEKQSGDGWHAVASQFSFRTDCTAAISSCVTLIRGAELRPLGLPWSARSGQCEVNGPNPTTPVEPGVYRLVVSRCDGLAAATSEPFSLDAH